MKPSAISFGTKAETLSALKDVIQSARVLPLEYFTVKEWREEKESHLGMIFEKFGKTNFVVRSSCETEDTGKESNAGVFESLLDIHPADLGSAIDEVILSFGAPAEEDQVLIQPMLRNVVRSGVCFSHDPSTCTPYRIISIAEGDDTTVVTGGGSARTYQIAAESTISPPNEVSAVLVLLNELSDIFKRMPIDIEFAFTREGDHEFLWLLQVRPLIMREKSQTSTEQSKKLSLLHSKISEGMKVHPNLFGKTNVFGVMPDWNPAEIIGLRPKPLALTLYRELITDGIWAYQRDNYGYRNLRSFPVMVNFFGLPYIDVRVSFNSFIPKCLKKPLGNKLVDYYLGHLVSKPHLHDKVEFDVILSCYTLDIEKRLKIMSSENFSEDELVDIKSNLRLITNRIIDPILPIWQKDVEKIKLLGKRHSKLMESGLQPIEKLYWVIENTKRYGTLPFSGLARVGFIAVQFLRSLVEKGFLSDKDQANFMLGIKTISSEIRSEKHTLTKKDFLNKFGHLRPGSYDICSLRYDADVGRYFSWDKGDIGNSRRVSFSLKDDVAGKLDEELVGHGLKTNSLELLKFIETGITLRELAKFEFSRCLSDALELIAAIGKKMNLTREDMSFSDIAIFKELYFSVSDPEKAIKTSIQNGKRAYRDTSQICLPPLITNAEQVWCFEWPNLKPNFITSKVVEGRVLAPSDKNIENSIVCIPSADPGYDWLFSHAIKGLITAWGGANSHMAIRAGELGVPAVIGAGEELYNKWSTSKFLRMDCSAQKVEIIE